MTPALTQPAFSAGIQTRRERLEPPRPLGPSAALRTAPGVGVERGAGHARRQLLPVDAGGQGGTNITAKHPAIVPGAGSHPRTGGRRA